MSSGKNDSGANDVENGGETRLLLTTLSFVVWVYTLGGPFRWWAGVSRRSPTKADISRRSPRASSSLWTLIVPLFIESPKAKGAVA